ncbi:MAG TPA: UDP-2,4-diacetamido-2,4,6-trideoxy-beta-L-altropyranose hydrolase [Ramlibacter sp.]|uniref:UDP-2,4-diacetamido-2,4, 6-trideoxy-beta-L-altropyranose hydrolase n=1 Tax=Ramlibacter sp. TaxID=1917967 RepID=UPI002D7E600B|nr:UDP-2,4-diacetamido-2,4,6-trideoxy-beta-L-altropyranose hydrolase [Ramlibacter sp.]HET8747201.1 UDP-2,4-diacetamido-2,4,6-trideoxy-beta-L-altropyranose hydrolase [Ramlibacter sp.]
MRVALRCDASGGMGTGHVRRCVALARALREEGVETRLVCRRHDAVSEGAVGDLDVAWLPAPSAGLRSLTEAGASGSAPPAARSRGSAPAYEGPSAPRHAPWAGVSWEEDAQETARAVAGFQPDWVLVDHYAFDARWEQAVAQATGARIAAIDDLADRAHAVELLVDQNLQPPSGDKYAGRIAPATRRLLGPRYALLAREYATAARYRFRRQVRSIGIFLSGADAHDASSAALRACREEAGFTGEIELVSSARSPHLARQQELARRWPGTRVLTDLPDLRAFFARHDLQVGSGGGAAWERCCIGAPSVALQIAANQAAVLPRLAELGAVEFVPDPQRLGHVVAELVAQPRRRVALARAARGLVDGLGSARVAAVLALAVDPQLAWRTATLADEAMLLEWANDPQARALAFQPRRILPREHHAWFAARLARPQDCLLLIATSRAGTPVGVVRFEREETHWVISYSLDTAFRGWGHGPRLLAGALEALRQRFGPVQVQGWVRRDNAASLQVFRRLGFEESRVERDGAPCHLFRRHLT